MAYYFYFWRSDNIKERHNGDVYLLAPVVNYSDNWDDSDLVGFYINNNCSLDVGGNPEMDEEDFYSQWNIVSDESYSSVMVDTENTSGVIFLGKGTVRFSAQTGASGASRYLDDKIRFYSDLTVTNTSSNDNTTPLDQYTVNVATWSLVGAKHHTSVDLFYLGYKQSGSGARNSAVEAKTSGDNLGHLIIDSSFGGYTEVHTAFFSQGSYNKRLNYYSFYYYINTANGTNTTSAGFISPTIEFKGSFDGSIYVTSQVNFRTSALYEMTDNFVASYGFSSNAALSMKNGNWSGQIAVVSTSSKLIASSPFSKEDMASARYNATYSSSTTSSGGETDSGDVTTEGGSTAGSWGWDDIEGDSQNGTLSNNKIYSTTIKTSSADINILSAKEKIDDDHLIHIVDYDVVPEGRSIEIKDEEESTSVTVDFEGTKGVSTDGQVLAQKNAPTITWNMTDTDAASVTTFKIKIEAGAGAFKEVDINDPNLTKETSDKTVSFSYFAKDWENVENYLGKGDIIVTTDNDKTCTSESYYTQSQNKIVWKREQAATQGGFLIYYYDIPLNSDDEALEKVYMTPVYIDYSNENLKYEDGVYTYTCDLSSTNRFITNLLNETNHEYEIISISELGTDAVQELPCYDIQEYSSVEAGGYNLTWYVPKGSELTVSDLGELIYNLGTEKDKNYDIATAGKVTLETYNIDTITAYQNMPGLRKSSGLVKQVLTIEDTNAFQSSHVLANDVVFYAESSNNQMSVDFYLYSWYPYYEDRSYYKYSLTLNNNQIEATALSSFSSVKIASFLQGVRMEVKVNDNSITYAKEGDAVKDHGSIVYTSENNEINAIGIGGSSAYYRWKSSSIIKGKGITYTITFKDESTITVNDDDDNLSLDSEEYWIYNVTGTDYNTSGIVKIEAKAPDVPKGQEKMTVTVNDDWSFNYGSNIILHDFYGTISIDMENNELDCLNTGSGSSITNYMMATGLYGTSLVGTSNLYGNIEIVTANNLMNDITVKKAGSDITTANYIAAGVYLYGKGSNIPGTLEIVGSLNTNITITADTGDQCVAGYFVKALQSRGMNGVIKLTSGDDISTLSKIGIYVNSISNPDCDLYTMCGDIILTGGATENGGVTKNIGIVTKEKLNLLVLGSIIVEGADENYVVKTDYGKSITSANYCDDILEIGAGGKIVGVVDMGSGKNTVIFDSQSRFNGYVEHGLGATNYIFRLNGKQEESICTIDSTRDATLTSGTTITVDCNLAKVKTEYKLFEYKGEELLELADAYWLNTATLTISIQNNTGFLQFNNGSAELVLDDLTIKGKYESGVVSVTVERMTSQPEENTVYSVGFEKDEYEEVKTVLYCSSPDEIAAEKIDRLLLAYKTYYRIQYEKERLKNSSLPEITEDDEVIQNALINTTENSDAESVSSTIKLQWFSENVQRNADNLFELDYSIYDAEGNLVSRQIERLSAESSLLYENIIEGENLYSYTVYAVPDGGYVDWTIRDYAGGGMIVSAKTETASLQTEVPSEKGHSSFSAFTNLVASNVSGAGTGLDTAAVKFAWDKANSFYSIDHYNLQYFAVDYDLETDSNQNRMDEIYEAYEEALEYHEGQNPYITKDGYTFRFVSGVIKFEYTLNGVKKYGSFYTKETTSTQILSTGMTNQGYVYWRVQGVDIRGESSDWDQGVGLDFRIYEGDKAGPVFDSSPQLKAVGTYSIAGDTLSWDISNITWNVPYGNLYATDSGSGVRSYVIKYENTDDGTTGSCTFSKNDFFQKGNVNEITPQTISGLSSGTYTLKLVARDHCGNEGPESSSITVYLQDHLKPSSSTVNVDNAYEFFEKSDNVLHGYYYSFDWEASVDTEDSSNMATGIKSYTINWGYQTSSGVTDVIEYSIWGTNKNTGVMELIKTVSGSFDLTELDLRDDMTFNDYSHFTVKSDTLLEYRSTLTQLTGNQYYFSVKVSDNANNVTILYNNTNLDISTVPDLTAPTGHFTKNPTSSIEINSRAEVTEPEEYEEAVTGAARSATVNLHWEDDYSDPSGICYLLNFSDNQYFVSDKKFAILLVDSELSSEKVNSLYKKFSVNYSDLRIMSVQELKGGSHDVSISNIYPTVDSGLFARLKKVYWNVKAADTEGNLCDAGSTGYFTFTDPERGNSYITITEDPAVPTGFKITNREYSNIDHVYSGAFDFEWSAVNEGFGIDKYVLNVEDSDGEDVYTRTISWSTFSTESLKNPSTSTKTTSSITKGTLADGKYTATVKSYGATGLYSSVESELSFTIDTVAPTSVKTVSATAIESNAYGDSRVFVSWGVSTDATSGVSHYLVHYKKSEETEWNEEVVDGTQTYCQLMLSVSSVKLYDFEVIAVDKSGTYDKATKSYSGGNYSSSTKISGVTVDYKDIDAKGDYEYQKSFTGELIGGADAIDMIKVDSGIGELRITISSLKLLYGDASDLVITLLNNQKIQVKQWTLSTSDNAASVDGQLIKYCSTNSNSFSYIKITSRNSSSTMQYNFSYEFDSYQTERENSIAYTTENVISGTGSYTGGTGISDISNIQIGYGMPVSYTKLDLTYDGKYTFDLSKVYNDTDSLATATFTLYKIAEGANNFTKIKSFTLKCSDLSSSISDVLLDAGSYFIRLEAPKANAGANVRLNVDVSGNIYSMQNTNDDFFANLRSDYCCSILETNGDVKGRTDLFGKNTDTTIEHEWVGYGDSIDYRAVDIAYAGVYQFCMLKNTSTGPITYTLYKKDRTDKTSLTKVKSITVAANKTMGDFTMSLEAGTYYVSVSAGSAKKGDSIPYYGYINNMAVYNYTAANGSIETASMFEVTGDFYYPVTTVLQADSQYIGYGGADAWYNLQINGKANQTISLTKQSYLDTQSPVTVTFYKTSADGTSLSAVKSMTVKATQEGGTLQINNVEAGNYVIRVSATKASSGKSLTYELELETSENYTASETAVYNSTSFVGAKAIYGMWDNDVLYYTQSYGADQNFVYYAFNTEDYAGEFSITGNADFVVYSLKDGALKLTKQTASSENMASVYLYANTTYYIAMENAGSQDPSHIIQINRQQARQVKDDNDWAELPNDCKIDVGAQEETFGWNSWVGFGDLYSSRMLTIENGGKYNFDLTTDTESTDKMPSVSMTLYKLNGNGTSLSAVKTIKAGQNTTQLLASGTYYAVVKASDVKGSVGYSVDVTKQFVAKDPTDNNNAARATAVKIEKCEIGGTEEGITGWVGYEDTYDYYQLSLDNYSTGFYTFSMNATDGTTFTLYAIKESNSALSSLYSYTFKDSAYGTTVASSEVLLDEACNYILMVKSTNAAKGGDSDYQFSTNMTSQAYQIIDGLKNVTQEERAAVFEITKTTAGKYSVSLAGTQTLWKINPENGKLTQVKVSSGGVNLTAGRYYIQGLINPYLSANTHCEIVFSAEKKVLTTSLVTSSIINVEKGNLADVPRTISDQYTWINLDNDSRSTANYTFTVSADYGGTFQIFVADKNAPVSGMRQVGGDYVLVQNASGIYTCTVDRQLMDNTSKYLFNFIPDGYDKDYKITQSAVEAKDQYSCLTTEVSAYNVYFSVDTTAEYDIDLASQQTLKMYNAETGSLVDLGNVSGTRTLEAGRYYIDSVASQTYLYELDQEKHTLSSTLTTIA